MVKSVSPGRNNTLKSQFQKHHMDLEQVTHFRESDSWVHSRPIPGGEQEEPMSSSFVVSGSKQSLIHSIHKYSLKLLEAAGKAKTVLIAAEQPGMSAG